MINQKVEVYKRGKNYADATRIVNDSLLEPGEGMIRIRNHFAGVNGLFDRTAIQGIVGYLELSPPFDLGVEAIGVVEAAGENTGFSIGDAVATSWLGSAYRHRQIASASDVYPLPSLKPEYLAIVPTGVSALIAMEKIAELKSGETLVITAAAGGLGHIWVQLAVNLGAKVIGIAGSDKKCEFVRSLGAADCINYHTESVASFLENNYKDSVNVAVDTVGGNLFDALLDNIAPLGRLIVSGYASELLDGAKPVLQPRVYEKLYWKGASIRGYMNALMTEHHRHAAARLFEMMDKGELKVSIDPTEFNGLESLSSASEHMTSGRNIGKTVLDLR